MSKIIFTVHSVRQMRERNIHKEQVIETLNNPDIVIPQEDLKKQSVKLFEKHNKKYLLIVICKEERRTKKIITAFITSKIKKYLH